jgi:hypothetical protein|tara:strand:+ start:1371 stop:2039 length:669 start_codon:yes stop_codon:yes gene_type:complete
MPGPRNSDWVDAFRDLGVTEAFYLTPLDNLDSILTNGLLPQTEVNRRGLVHSDISEHTVQVRRDQRDLRSDGISSHGLHDFVPLYFARRTPMSSRRRDHNSDLCILVINVAKVCLAADELLFSNGNAGAHNSEIFSNPAELEENLPLQVIKASYWPEFPDGRLRRQAELLVHPTVPTPAIRFIEIVDAQNQQRVNGAIQRAQTNQPVDWICECTVSPSAFFT